jgi:hypothetical protein
LTGRLLTLGWLRRAPQSQAVPLIEPGRRATGETFGVDLGTSGFTDDQRLAATRRTQERTC